MYLIYYELLIFYLGLVSKFVSIYHNFTAFLIVYFSYFAIQLREFLFLFLHLIMLFTIFISNFTQYLQFNHLLKLLNFWYAILIYNEVDLMHMFLHGILKIILTLFFSYFLKYFVDWSIYLIFSPNYYYFIIYF